MQLQSPKPPPPLSVDGRRGVWLVLWIFLVYSATITGLTSSNDGSHYALLRAIFDQQTVEISSYAEFTEDNDQSQVGSSLYTDRPPGTALMGLPFYALGRVLPRPSLPLPSRHDEENPALLLLLMAPVTFSMLTGWLFYRLLRRWELSSDAAFLSSLALAFGTIQWKYGTVFFSHAPAALLLMGALTCVQKLLREKSAASWGAMGGLGASLGMLVLVEYATLPLALAIPLWLLWQKRADFHPEAMPADSTLTEGSPQPVSVANPNRKGLLALGLGLLLPLLFLAWYNAAHFGAPWVTSYAYNVKYPWARSFWTTFDGSLVEGLEALLLFSRGKVMTTLHLGAPVWGVANQGLLLLSPVFLCAFMGTWDAWKETTSRPAIRREVVLVMTIALAYLLLFATHHTAHGGMRDGRYLAPFLPLLMAPLGFFVQKRVLARQPDATGLAYTLLFFGLMFLSIRGQALHIAFSYNYEYDLNRIRSMAADPRDLMGFLRSLFPNAWNLPYLLGIFGLLGGGGALLWKRVMSRESAQSLGPTPSGAELK